MERISGNNRISKFQIASARYPIIDITKERMFMDAGKVINESGYVPVRLEKSLEDEFIYLSFEFYIMNHDEVKTIVDILNRMHNFLLKEDKDKIKNIFALSKIKIETDGE